MPPEWRTCKDYAILAQPQRTMITTPKFKQIANVAIFTSHYYGNPTTGRWVEKQYVSVCGEKAGVQILANAREGELPALEIDYYRGIDQKAFMPAAKTDGYPISGPVQDPKYYD